MENISLTDVIPDENYNHLSWSENDEIMIEGCKVKDLVKKFGTPLNVISETQLRNNARLFKTVFEERWTEGEVRILPAIKANFTLALRNILTEEGCGCDVYSYGELVSALNSGIDPFMISINGNAKLIRGNDSIKVAVEKGIRITIDIKEEIFEVERIAKEMDKKAYVRLRLRPDYTNMPLLTQYLEANITVGLGQEMYKAGLPVADVLSVGKYALESEYLELIGAHLHVGRHRRDSEFWKYVIEGYAILLGRLKKELHGWEPDEIDIGGGIPCRRDPNCQQIVNARKAGEKVGMALEKIHRSTGDERRKAQQEYLDLSREQAAAIYKADPFTIIREPLANYADVITQTLRKTLKENDIEPHGKILEIEPGRAMYGDAGIHIASVTALKTEKEPFFWQWLNCNTAEHFMLNTSYSHAIYRYMFEGYPQSKMNAEDMMIADIVGSSCNFDRLVADAVVPKNVKRDDLIVFIDTAAYNVPMSGNFNAMPRPAMALVCNEEVELIKKAETIEDVFAKDIVPDRLVQPLP